MTIEAEAATDRDAIVVYLVSKAQGSSDLPDSVCQYVLRTKEG